MKTVWIFLFVTTMASSHGQSIVAHDPVMIREGSRYYLFCTGRGISVYSSEDTKNWKKEKPVFDAAPPWAVEAVPGFRNHIWAPDISYREGRYYLYYSVSAFGKNTSCIGVATSPTLNAEHPDYKWTDHGKVIQSVPGRDLWNAIDPNLAYDDKGQPWLSFGSFWSGIKLVRMNPDLLSIAQPEEWYSISKRPRDYTARDEDPEPGAVEAPFIFRRNGYYYLFVSFDYCCRGEKSTYRIMAGRSKNIQGPYFDKEGVSLNEGGGTQVLAGDRRWAGLGHNSVYTFDGTDYLVFHAYDMEAGGKPKLRIEPLAWENDWPVVKSVTTK